MVEQNEEKNIQNKVRKGNIPHGGRGVTGSVNITFQAQRMQSGMQRNNALIQQRGIFSRVLTLCKANRSLPPILTFEIVQLAMQSSHTCHQCWIPPRMTASCKINRKHQYEYNYAMNHDQSSQLPQVGCHSCPG